MKAKGGKHRNNLYVIESMVVHERGGWNFGPGIEFEEQNAGLLLVRRIQSSKDKGRKSISVSCVISSGIPSFNIRLDRVA